MSKKWNDLLKIAEKQVTSWWSYVCKTYRGDSIQPEWKVWPFAQPLPWLSIFLLSRPILLYRDEVVTISSKRRLKNQIISSFSGLERERTLDENRSQRIGLSISGKKADYETPERRRGKKRRSHLCQRKESCGPHARLLRDSIMSKKFDQLALQVSCFIQ